MSKRRFVEVVDARHYSEFMTISRTELDQLRHELGRLGDGRHSTFVLGALPEGKTFINLGGIYDPPEYIQCAGTAEALTIEAREIVDGQARHYTLGRREPRGGEVSVEYGSGYSVAVHENEVFTSDEAATIFLVYMDGDGAIPEGFELREHDPR